MSINLEYLVANAILKEYKCKIIDSFTKSKFKRLQQNYTHNNSHPSRKKIKEVLKKLIPDNQVLFLYFMRDCIGCKGDNSDIVIKTINENIMLRLSIKNNNNMIKHHCPGRLLQQCGLKSPKLINIFKTQYEKLCKRLHKKLGNKKLYCQVDRATVNYIYRQINTLILAWLKKQSLKHKKEYIRFLLGIKNTKILCWKKTYFEINTVQNIIPNDIIINRVANKIIIKCGDKYNINMRLHTSKSKIGQKLSIKYAVTFSSIPNMYKT